MRPLRLPAVFGVASALVTGGLAAITQPAPVRAHAIESSLERLSALNAEGKASIASQTSTLQLESRFSTGEPAHGATVRLVQLGGEGEPVLLGQTDSAGQLRFQLPQQAGSDWEVQVDAGPGHRDYLELNDTLAGPLAAEPLPAVRRTPLARKLGEPQLWLEQRSKLLVGLTGAGLGAAGLLRLSRRRR
jgi:nickel transport protein